MRSVLVAPRALPFVLLAVLAFVVAPLCRASIAQTVAAPTGTLPVLRHGIPERIPSTLPLHLKKTDLPLMYARLRDGVYSVDGRVGKVQLNYDVRAAGYLYLFVPGVGTALLSLAPSPDAVSMPAAYKDGELTVRAGDHTLNLTGVESLVDDRGKPPTKLYVRLDRGSWGLSRTPMVGFGTVNDAPYEWPEAQRPESAEDSPLPVPASLLPRKLAFQVPAAAPR